MKLTGQIKTNITFITTSVRLNLMIVHDLFFFTFQAGVYSVELESAHNYFTPLTGLDLTDWVSKVTEIIDYNRC